MPANNPVVPVGSPTILMLTHVLCFLPLAHHHATICSAGSKGYCAVKEMLQSGVPGHTLLIESGDLRNVESSTQECCLIYTSRSGDDVAERYCDHFPETIEHLALYSNSLCLPPVLLDCVGIRTVDLSPLSQVTEIQGYFFQGCDGLTTLDLSPLSQVTVIHSWSFLEGCTVLTALDLSPLSQLTVVQGSFLERCRGLTTLDLGPLSRVTVISWSFLQDCSGLTSLDLGPLSQVIEVQSSFLQGCTGLTSLDLSPLSQVTEVQWAFLGGCSGLTTLDLSPLSQVTVIQGYFLQGCTGLDEVSSPPLCPPPSGWAARTTTGSNNWVRESLNYPSIVRSI